MEAMAYTTNRESQNDQAAANLKAMMQVGYVTCDILLALGDILLTP